MRRRLPPLDQIEAFVVAAAAPSFRVAAERCALSPAAFSRRIQGFSAYVGLKLFERSSGGARLTDAGRRCLNELEPAYMELLRAASAVGQNNGRGHDVKLSLSHALAVGWLVPRLKAFRAAHPEIELSFTIQRGASDIRRGSADLGICFSDIDVSGLVVQPLLDVSCTPVASPSLAQTFRAEGGQLGDYRLLSITSPPGIWQWWSTATGLRVDDASVTSFEMLHAMYESASQGLGITIGSTPTIWPHLESGRLERLDFPVVHYPGGYQLAASSERRRQRPVATVWRWLEAEAKSTPSFHDRHNAAA